MSSPRRTSLTLALGGSLAGLVALTAAVVGHARAPLPVDTDVLTWMLRQRTPALRSAAVVVTDTGSGVPAYVLAAAAGWFAASGSRRQGALGALAGLASLLLGQGIRLVIAFGVGRPRPAESDWAASAGGAAYPSGHTVTSALVAALICVAAARRLQGAARHGVRVAALTWAGLVGMTRIFLGVHWTTDVVGGWLLAAVLVAGACLLVRAVPLPRATPEQGHGPDRQASTPQGTGG